MKKINVIITAIILLFVGQVNAQDTFQTGRKSSIRPLELGLSYHKTTNLIFPYAIKSVDKGSKDILVQKAKGMENLLQLKAGTQNFRETNLTVVTSDGSLYSFLLSYAFEPTSLNLELADKPMGYEPVAIFTSFKDNQAKIQATGERIAVKKKTLRGKRDHKFNVGLGLSGVYIKEHVLYYQLEIENNSNIAYDIEQLRFFIRDKKKAKRTATQEIEQHPLYITGNATVIGSQSKQTIVVALEKFTIPDKKEFVIQLMEKNGGRHLQLKLGNKQVIQAIVLN